MNGGLATDLVVGALAVVGGIAVVWWAIASGRREVPALPLTPYVRSVAAEGRLPARPSLIARLGRWVRRFTSQRRVDRIDRIIQRAGQPEGWSVDRMLALKVIASGGLGLLGVAMVVSSPGALSVLVLVIGTVGGFMVPEMLLTSRAENRRAEVQRALPDAIDQLAVTVRAGLSVDSSLLRVSQTLRGPLADELLRVVQDVRLGVSRADALRAFADRIDVPELHLFVRALVQADSLGVPVSTTLTAQAHEMRIRRRQRSEEQAMKLPVKILMPTVLCILPALLMVVLGPAVIGIVRSLGGS